MQRTVTHNNPDTVWLFDYPSLEAMGDNPNRLVFLSERDWNIVEQATKDIDRYQARVWLEATGKTYLTVDDMQFETFQGWVSDLRIQLEDFAMIEELLAEIRDAILAVANKDCCPTGSPGSGIFNSGSRGAGITPEIPNPFTENPETEEPPVGFDTWEEYRMHKCNASADVVQNFKVDLLSLSNLIPEEKTFTQIMTFIVGVLLTPVPYDDLATLIGLLTALAFEYSLLAELSSGVQEDEDNLLCVLYQSANSSDAQASFRSAIETLVNEVTGVTLAQDWLDKITIQLTPPDVFNKMFTNGPTTIQDADCSGCVDTGPYTVLFGTETSTHPANPIEITSEYAPLASGGCGTDIREVQVNFHVPVTIDSVVIDGPAGACGGTPIYNFFAEEDFGTLISQGNASPQVGGVVSGVRSLYIDFDADGADSPVIITYTVE